MYLQRYTAAALAACFIVGPTVRPALPASSSRTKPDATATSFSKKLSADRHALHALNRLTFGPRPGDLEVVRKMGLKNWIEQQLHPERIDENPELAGRLRPLESLELTATEIVRSYPPPQIIVAYATGRLPMPEDPDKRALLERLSERYKQRIEKKDGKKANDGEQAADNNSPMEPAPATEPAPRLRGRRPERLASLSPEARRRALLNVAPQQVIARDLQEAKLYRATYSNRQLAEVMADFWFNHFNVFLDKGADRYLVTSYEREAIRPHVLGNFRDLLLATAQHPAMLFYLDNWQSVAPDAAMGFGRRGGQMPKRTRGLNENYARELLELHTLGVDGGYTQKDIIEVARCFTGWTIDRPYLSPEFRFNARVHDNGEKVVLGVTIPAGGGQADAEKVIDILSKHPSTATFVSRKLAQRFVADAPPEPLVAAMASTFRKTGGDIRSVLTTMLESREFWSEGAYRSKIKSPLEMVVSALRATDADVTYAFGVAQKVAELGQPLYRKQEPTGYSNTSGEWVNSAGLLGRMNFALALVQNQLPGTTVSPNVVTGPPEEIAKRLLNADPSPQTRAAIARGVSEKRTEAVIAGLILGSPEFQRR